MNRKTFLYHSLFWGGIYLLWVALFRSYSFALARTVTIEFCYLIFITADFYAIHYFASKWLLPGRKYVLFIVAALAVLGISAWCRALVAQQMNLHRFHSMPSIGFGQLYLNSVINISLWVLLISAGKMAIDSVRHQRQLELLEKDRVQNELDYLKAQINPHSLFNSLNTIYGHIDKNNHIARRVLLQFSELLRYQLYDCGVEKVGLEMEMKYIENYIAFQRLRKEEGLIVDFQVEIGKGGLTIAPLLLVVLIENAFKFVSNFSEKENRISVKIYTSGGVLHGSFTNTKELLQASVTKNANGIGIANLKRRLDLLYPQKYEWTTRVGNDLYETDLKIDLS